MSAAPRKEWLKRLDKQDMCHKARFPPEGIGQVLTKNITFGGMVEKYLKNCAILAVAGEFGCEEEPCRA